MPVEEIIKELKKQDRIIDDALKAKKELYAKLETAGKEDYDWISVQAAAKLIDVSVYTIYNKINSGTLKTKHINSAIRVSKKEILQIDDKYEA